MPETFYEDFASILEACEIEEEEETSGGATTLHAPVLETPAAGPSARVRPRVTDGGGGKAGNQIEEERGQEGQAESRGLATSEEQACIRRSHNK